VESSVAAQASVFRHMSENLAAARYHHFVLGCQNATERVMSFLVRLAARKGVFAGDRLDLPMGRQDIADHLGLTIETVSRAIGTLKSEGAISVPNAHQLILNSLNHRNATPV
jgi:CRP/FNR family nitrogen fixation transcriptional regulator